MKNVAILAYPNLSTFEFGCAVELFALERLEIQKCYRTDVISIQKEPIKAMGGFLVETDLTFTPNINNDYFNNYDMLVIAGWSGQDIKAPSSLLDSLRNYYYNGGTLISFCGGAFVLAATGLLDGKTATTHWRFAESFKEQFPQINLLENVLYTEEDRIYTSAGSAAGLDLGLHLIRKDFGASIANEIAKRLVIPSRRDGGQAQYTGKIVKPIKPNNLSKSMAWVNENLQKQITVDEMAEHACLSRRSFDRHFRKNFNTSPKEWLVRQRVDFARELLECSQANIEEIADQAGFGNTMNLRHHFNQVLGVSPTHYRNQFFRS